MDQNSVLQKVRKLIERAEHPGTPSVEADAARQMADDLMLKYAIDEALFEQAKSVSERAVPQALSMVLCDAANPATPWIISMADAVARYCRSQMVIFGYGGKGDVSVTFYGYESDLKFLEIVYTVLFLHLGSHLSPKWDNSRDETWNVVELHKKGLNWLNIAAIHPDPEKRWTRGDDTNAVRLGSAVKRVYMRWCRDNGQRYIATGNRISYIKSFAQAYQIQVSYRLRELAARRDNGSHGTKALALRSGDLEEWMRQQFPDMKVVNIQGEIHTNNPAAYAAGTAAGLEADLSGGTGRINERMDAGVIAPDRKALT